MFLSWIKLQNHNNKVYRYSFLFRALANNNVMIINVHEVFFYQTEKYKLVWWILLLYTYIYTYHKRQIGRSNIYLTLQ